MKRYRVHVTQKAIDEMTEIGRYISEELLEPNLAVKLLDKLEKAIYGLESMPLKYPLVYDKYLSDQGIRKLPVENYIIFFTVSDENSKVNIVRVLYQKINWMNLL